MPRRKFCPKCRKAKTLSHFGRDKHCSDGLKIWCKSCRKISRAAHYRKNRKRILAQTRAWQRANPEAVARIFRAYCKRHPEKRAELSRDWIAANRDYWVARRSRYNRQFREKFPEKIKAREHTKRVKRLGAAGRYTASDIKRLLKEQNRRCVYCSESLCDGYHVDHKIPLVRGGTNWPYNIHLTCGPCNQRKRHRTHDEFLRIIYQT